jgi:pathogenesis-related protein 1
MIAYLVAPLALCICARRTASQEPPAIELKPAQIAALQLAEKTRFLAAHNAARKAVGVEPLAWSEELSKVAQESLNEQKDELIEEAKKGWAERKIVLPEHRMDSKYGENIAGWAGAGNRLPGVERAVTWWIEEKVPFDKLNAEGTYKFGDEEGKTEKGPDGKDQPIVVGHYTQIVWRTTTHVGAARLTFQLADKSGVTRTYVAVICNYSPPGNVNGEKPF